jgi:hypothetical protein
MVDDTQKEQTLGSDNPEAAKTETENTAKAQEGKTFTEDDLNRIVKERLDRERKKFADYNDLKAAKQKLDEIEKAKLSDEEKAKQKLDELNKQIEERDKILKDKALKDIYREKIEQAIADGRMKLPKGKTIASLVARSKAVEEGEIDADVEDLIGFFPPDEPTKAIGGGSQQAPVKSLDIKDQIAALTAQAADPKTSAQERYRIQSEINSLRLRVDGIIR